jgi:nucleotide-binding universal stress UspA family protein
MKILLAIDDSSFTGPAIQAVITRGHNDDTEVRVLQVVKPPSLLSLSDMGGYDTALADDWDEETEQAHVLVGKTADTLRSHGMKVSTSVEQGDSESTIIKASEKWHADLIVMGGQRGRRFWHLWRGGLSEAIVLHARCSVEIVRVLPGHEETLATS